MAEVDDVLCCWSGGEIVFMGRALVVRATNSQFSSAGRLCHRASVQLHTCPVGVEDEIDVAVLARGGLGKGSWCSHGLWQMLHPLTTWCGTVLAHCW